MSDAINQLTDSLFQARDHASTIEHVLGQALRQKRAPTAEEWKKIRQAELGLSTWLDAVKSAEVRRA